ncbi:MAG TPA: LacI family DNA-binding transcriptional regulator [Feifaniaceae bacterium]|nr:LacI family DNA-binding transcriptional regulator [Feifaniaceae bacterium]
MEDKKGQPKKLATIIDVARLADVSISTVSRVINRQGGVSDELGRRIFSAIETLHYKPNSVAQALKSKSTRLIGVIIPSVSNPIFSVLTKSLEEAAERYDYSLLISSSDSSVEKEVKCLDTLINHQVDGIVFNGMGVYDPRFSRVYEAGLPLIYIGRKIEGFPCSNVTINNKKGAYVAVTYLIESGARRIGFIFGKHESISATEDRFMGYKEALENSGIPFDDALIVRTRDAQDDGGRYATRHLLDTVSDLDAIFVSNDLMALGCLNQLQIYGKKVPKEIAVMGYDGIPYGKFMTPSLSTMIVPSKEMATAAVEMLMRRIDRPDYMEEEIVFETQMYLGASTKKPTRKSSFKLLETV